MKKIMPYPTIIIIQFLCLLFLILSCPPVILYVQMPIKVILLLIMSVLGFSNLMLMIMSVLRWWNVPITITAEGCFKKRKKYNWSDVVCVSLTKRWKSQYGPIVLISLKFKNDESISFEKSDYVLKVINQICKDGYFLEILKREIDNFL